MIPSDRQPFVLLLACNVITAHSTEDFQVAQPCFTGEKAVGDELRRHVHCSNACHDYRRRSADGPSSAAPHSGKKVNRLHPALHAGADCQAKCRKSPRCDVGSTRGQVSALSSGMERPGYDVSLTRYEEGWRATFIRRDHTTWPWLGR
jgi:hypothetical protein